MLLGLLRCAKSIRIGIRPPGQCIHGSLIGGPIAVVIRAIAPLIGAWKYLRIAVIAVGTTAGQRCDTIAVGVLPIEAITIRVYAVSHGIGRARVHRGIPVVAIQPTGIHRRTAVPVQVHIAPWSAGKQ